VIDAEKRQKAIIRENVSQFVKELNQVIKKSKTIDKTTKLKFRIALIFGKRQLQNITYEIAWQILPNINSIIDSFSRKEIPVEFGSILKNPEVIKTLADTGLNEESIISKLTEALSSSFIIKMMEGFRLCLIESMRNIEAEDLVADKKIGSKTNEELFALKPEIKVI
jgi:hypothetical protein